MTAAKKGPPKKKPKPLEDLLAEADSWTFGIGGDRCYREMARRLKMVAEHLNYLVMHQRWHHGDCENCDYRTDTLRQDLDGQGGGGR